MLNGATPSSGPRFEGGSVDGCDSRAGQDLPWPEVEPTHSERYQVGGLIGRGGMGHVLIAHDRLLDREVALKVVRPDRAAGPNAAQRLAAEARVTASLDHPSIVAVHDIGAAKDGTPFYIMRLVRGRSLSEEITSRQTLEERLGLLRAVLTATEALAYAHHRGVVHRDIKPDNVMLGEFGEVQVMDWGLAVPSGHVDPGPVGTQAYSSPEQTRGEPVQSSADVWSLGILLLELVLGRPQEPGTTATVLASLAHTNGPHPAPPELLAVIAGCLHPDPLKRLTTRALADDLRRFLDGRRVAAYTYPLSALLARLVRAWRVPLIVGAVALVVLAAVLISGRARLIEERDRAAEALANLYSEQAVVHFEAGRLREAAESAARALTSSSESSTQAGLTQADARGALMARHSPMTRSFELDLPGHCPLARLDPSGRWLLCLGLAKASLWELGRDQPAAWRHLWTRDSTATQGHILPDSMSVVLVEQAAGKPAQTPASDPVLTRVALDSGHPLGEHTDWAASEFLTTRTRAVALNGGLLLLAPTDATPAQVIRGPCRTRINVVAAAPDEKTWAVACSDGELLHGPVGEVPTRRLAPPNISDDLTVVGPTAMALGTDRLVWADLRGRLRLMEIRGEATETAWKRELPGSITRLAMDELIWLTMADGSLRVLSMDGDDLDTLPIGSATRGLSRDDQGQVLALGEHSVSAWTPPAAWLPHRMSLAPGTGLTGAVPSTDGNLLAASVADGRLMIVATNGQRVVTRRPRNELAKPVAWSRDGLELSGSWMTNAGVVTLATDTWNEKAPGGRATGTAVRRTLALADGLTLAVAYDHRTVLYRGIEAPLSLPGLAAETFVDAGASPDGALALLVPEGSAAVVVLEASTLDVRRFPTDATAQVGDIGNTRIIVLGRGTIAFVLDTNGRQRSLTSASARIADLAIMADERLVAGGLVDGKVAIWDLTNGELVARLHAHTERAAYVESLPDGHTLVSASWDGTARLWDLSLLSASPDALRQHLLTLTAPLDL